MELGNNSQASKVTAALNRKTATVFGTFHLDQSEFTLPVESIQEVVNYPTQITKLPLSPPFLIGIFNLRGTIIPMINMRHLLHFQEAEISPAHKIAIVDLMGAKVGMLFDRTGEILHVQDDQKSEFDYTETSNHRAIRGVLKLDEGNRIIQILDPSALLKIENLPQIIDEVKRRSPHQSRDSISKGPRKQCISFLAGKTRLAIEISDIHEIIKLPELQPSVIADENCLGMANIRGSILPVIDFVKLLNFRKNNPRDEAEERIIVMRVDEGTVGLLIDSVDNIVSFYQDDVLPVPLLNQARAEMFNGLVALEKVEEMILLNAHGILANPEIRILADGHRKLFGAHRTDAADELRKRSSGTRQVCIAFQLEHCFALPIHQIKEIIHFSENTIKPPGLPDEIRGVLNLRGEAVTMVDLRIMYGLAPFADFSQVKVLIVEHQKSKFGLLVDSVENIITFFDDQKLELPKGILAGEQQSFSSEVKEIIEIPVASCSEKKSLMILDLNKVLARIEGVIQHAA